MTIVLGNPSDCLGLILKSAIVPGHSQFQDGAQERTRSLLGGMLDIIETAPKYAPPKNTSELFLGLVHGGSNDAN